MKIFNVPSVQIILIVDDIVTESCGGDCQKTCISGYDVIVSGAKSSGLIDLGQ